MTPCLAKQYFDDGYAAYCDGVADDECPYERKSSAAEEWLDGWKHAAEEIGPDTSDDAYNDPRRGLTAELNRKFR